MKFKFMALSQLKTAKKLKGFTESLPIRHPSIGSVYEGLKNGE